ncbi:MAG: hypothetical protein J6Y43_06275 [Clostridia bacterium]|nr:hypothetical protein [Clostridia bacterium]
MFKALLKKQLSEINSYLFQNKRTGELYGKRKTVLVICLYALMFALIGVSFFLMLRQLCKPFSDADLSWLYFAIVGLLSLALGIFGSVFNTYAGLYRAKDNDLLLSMPVPPHKILAARIIGVFTSALVYQSIVYIPALIARFVYAPVSFSGVLFSIVLWLVMGVLITFFTIILGFLVAAVSARLKNKTVITVILFMVFFGAYYYLIFQAGDFVAEIIAAGEDIANGFRNFAYPLYCFGIAAEGNALAFSGFTAATAALFLLAMFIMSKTFIRITTGAKSGNKIRYKEKPIKIKTPSRALLFREFKRLFSSATVFLNCSLSTFLGVLFAVLLLINKGTVAGVFDRVGDEAYVLKNIFMAMGVGTCFMLSTMNNICGPSVSLEAKSIDLTKSLPVKTRDLFSAKQKLHIFMTLFPVLALAVCVALVLQADASGTIFIIVDSVVFVFYGSAFSFTMGLKFPNLKWTNEVVAVKQGAGNMITAFGGMGVAAAVGFGLYGLNLLMPLWSGLFIIGVVFAGLTVLLNLWIFKKGVKIFEEL